MPCLSVCASACSFPGPDGYRPYGGGWQSFVNAPARPEILQPGSTHVAIGFVDLGGLAAACEQLPARDGEALRMALLAEACSGRFIEAAAAHSRMLQPLRWVGYGLSAYCVAKSLVILEMMEQGVAVDDILQVRRVAAVCAGHPQACNPNRFRLCAGHDLP